jgi:hypothetical protein
MSLPTKKVSKVQVTLKGPRLGYQSIFLWPFFRSQEFIRVGYYVSNEYQDPELQETPPEQPLFEKLTRNILVCSFWFSQIVVLQLIG